MLSELARAFQIGFLIFLPFLIIDLVVAAVLMSMGMMMVPPAIVSLPFKLAFFVVADGWRLVSGACAGLSLSPPLHKGAWRRKMRPAPCRMNPAAAQPGGVCRNKEDWP